MESHFVKLEPPYQIIHYGGVVGIQIGTLITVGSERPGDHGIENIYTHSHPVVSYVDKQLLKTKIGKYRGNMQMASYYGGGEGNVWSKVQVSDVDVIGLWDTDQNEAAYSFEWSDFVELVSSGFSRLDVIKRTYRENGIFDLLNYLRKVGLEVVPPPPFKHLKMRLSLAYQIIEHGQIRGSLLCQAEEIDLAFYQPFGETYVKRSVEIFVHFIRQYLSIMRSLDATIEFAIGETENAELMKKDAHVAEENLKQLVKTLNDTYNEKYRMQQ